MRFTKLVKCMYLFAELPLITELDLLPWLDLQPLAEEASLGPSPRPCKKEINICIFVLFLTTHQPFKYMKKLCQINYNRWCVIRYGLFSLMLSLSLATLDWFDRNKYQLFFYLKHENLIPCGILSGSALFTKLKAVLMSSDRKQNSHLS